MTLREIKIVDFININKTYLFIISKLRSIQFYIIIYYV
jgi:hypothetical protein